MKGGDRPEHVEAAVGRHPLRHAQSMGRVHNAQRGSDGPTGNA